MNPEYYIHTSSYTVLCECGCENTDTATYYTYTSPHAIIMFYHYHQNSFQSHSDPVNYDQAHNLNSNSNQIMKSNPIQPSVVSCNSSSHHYKGVSQFPQDIITQHKGYSTMTNYTTLKTSMIIHSPNTSHRSRSNAKSKCHYQFTMNPFFYTKVINTKNNICQHTN